MADFNDDPYVQLQQARKAHRHAAHVYAHTKNTVENKPRYDAAVEQLEKAAMAFAMASMIFGSKAQSAAPAHPVRAAWDEATDPEPKR